MHIQTKSAQLLKPLQLSYFFSYFHHFPDISISSGYKTNKISINSKHSLNHHEDFLGFVHKKTNVQNSYSKLLKTLLIRIQRENVWICSKKQAVEMIIYCLLCLFCLFLVFDFLLVLVVSRSRNVEFFNQFNI